MRQSARLWRWAFITLKTVPASRDSSDSCSRICRSVGWLPRRCAAP